MAGTTSTPNAGLSQAPSGVYAFDATEESKWGDHDIWTVSYDLQHANAIARHRYPGTPGQAIEALGREPYSVTVESAWFGDDWRARLDNLLFDVDATQESARLRLPDGLEFDAFCTGAGERRDCAQDGIYVTLTFEEDAHVDAWVTTSTDDLVRAAELVPSEDAATVGLYVDEYALMVADPVRNTTRAMLDVLRRIEAARYVAQAACDTTTTAGIERFDALLLVGWYARRSFPEPSMLLTL